jgi:cell division protein FtsB
MLRNLTLTIVVFLIAFFTVFGRNGFLELLEYKSQFSQLEKRLYSLKSYILREEDTMYGLSNSPEYLEQVAREDLALSKSGEIIYIFDPSSEKGELERVTP